MPQPVSVTAIITYWPGVDLGVARRIVVVEKGIAGLDRELAVPFHRVARVDRQIEQRVLDLHRRRRMCSTGRRAIIVSISTPSPSARRSMSSMLRISRPRLTTFGASGCRRPNASSCDASFEPRDNRRDRRLQPLLGPQIASDIPDEQLKVAADDLQDVVEVVRHAAGQLADGLHLLRLAQLRLGLVRARRWRSRRALPACRWLAAERARLPCDR